VVVPAEHRSIGHQMKKGGPLSPGLILLLILQDLVHHRAHLEPAQGAGPGLAARPSSTACAKALHNGDIDTAIALCAKQRGSAANVIRAGLERYQQVRSEGASKEKIVSETQAAIQEANGSRCRCSSAT